MLNLLSQTEQSRVVTQRLVDAQLLSMNQLAMLPKAAEVQARIKGQLQAKAASQTPVGTDFDFLLSEEATFKFT